MKTLKVLGYITAATLAATLLWNWGDLRRYIKIETM